MNFQQKNVTMFHAAAGVESDLDEHAVLRALDSEIAFIGDVRLRRVLRNHLEAIIRRSFQVLDYAFIDDVCDRALVVRGFAADEIDTS